MIVPGSSWHDTVCGNPNDYATPRGPRDKIGSVFVKTLNDLAEAWIRALSESDVAKVCRFFSSEENACAYNVEEIFARRHMRFEHILQTLYAVSALQAARGMCAAVLKPFLRDVRPTTVFVEFAHPSSQFWAEPSKELVIKASLNVPLGSFPFYKPKEVAWATGLRSTDRVLLRYFDTRWRKTYNRQDGPTGYSLLKDHGWTRPDVNEFLVHTFDISLRVTNYRCDALKAPVTVHVVLQAETAQRSVQEVQKTIDVLCTWKPRLHADCNCTQALMDYTNPRGLCSPSCITHPSAQTLRGPPGGRDDWTLQLWYAPPRGFLLPESSKRGRVVQGSVAPNTQRFCVVTKDIFTRTPSPRRDVPSAPLDVRRCSVVLLQFQVARGRLENPDYAALPVRALHIDSGLRENRALRVPKAANETLTAMVRQQWGGELGVKLEFPSSFWNSEPATQRELAAVFDWLSALQFHNVIKFVVVDTQLSSAALSYFAKTSGLYSSVFEIIPGFAADALGDVIATRGDEPKPLTAGQRSAEALLVQVGNVVASHGAFLDLENAVCVTRDNVWRAGNYSSEDPYSIRLPRDARAAKRAGLFVFEELCGRSNNRGGIIVSVPSAGYRPSGDCGTPVERVSRHSGDSSAAITYDALQLHEMIGDMAKWGVSRYSLGHLDYTFGGPNAIPTFIELANLVDSATARERTLHYRYTRTSAFGGGGSATVDGVYKLEGGVFFQKVTESTPRVQSFMSVPGISRLRLGLSSDMNVGAPLTLTDRRLARETETVQFIPRGARAVDLDYKSAVAFVDRDKDTICVYWPNATSRRNDSRFPSLGARRTVELRGERSNNVSCRRRARGAQHRARLTWTLPVAREYKRSALDSLSKLQTWLGSSVVTKEERDWWTGADSRVRESEKRDIPGVLDRLHFESQVYQCLSGSSSCAGLGDYAINGWPQGGAGYPVAIRGIDSDTEISVKLIVAANYGSLAVKSPCDIVPFSLGSDRRAPIAGGYYAREQGDPLSDAIAYGAGVEQHVTEIAQQLLLSLRCNRTASRREYLRAASECVTATEDAVAKSKEFSSDVVATIRRNGDAWQSATQQLAFRRVRSAALCLSALLLALAIHAALVATLCCLRKETKRNASRCRKAQ